MSDRTRTARDDLEKLIRNAFADVPRPADSHIIKSPGDYDADELYQHVAGKTWQSLLGELLTTQGPDFYFYHSTYRFFTPQAFQYYLPAFMIVSLDLIRADIVCEYLMFALRPYPGSWFADFVALNNAAQRESIRRFIAYLYHLSKELNVGDVTEDKSLRRYWFPEGFPGRNAPSTGC